MGNDTQDLLRLADELEKATGPDRRLDYWIMTKTVSTGRGYLWDPEDQNHRYTASLDAAMTLVPEGWDYEVGRYDGILCCARVWLRGFMNDADHLCAATPALALCAAALKARAHSTKEPDHG